MRHGLRPAAPQPARSIRPAKVCSSRIRGSAAHELAVGLPACASQCPHLQALACRGIALRLGACRCQGKRREWHTKGQAGSAWWLLCTVGAPPYTVSLMLPRRPHSCYRHHHHQHISQPGNSLRRAAARSAQGCERPIGKSSGSDTPSLHAAHWPVAVLQMGVASGHWTLLVHWQAPVLALHSWCTPVGPAGQ